jgi:hypothetical protein
MLLGLRLFLALCRNARLPYSDFAWNRSRASMASALST